MWASLETGIPTINGYSGTWPPAIRKLIMSDIPARRADIQNELARWCKQNHLYSKRIGWIVADKKETNTVPLTN